MRQPDRSASPSRPSAALISNAWLQRSVGMNVVIALIVYGVFGYVFPLFFRGGGAIEDVSEVGTLSAQLATGFQETAGYVAGIFLFMALIGGVIVLIRRIRGEGEPEQ
ncbi:MAG: hypothetical protein H6981_12095 [Gammaproteobacteria bacterium]|nr:hypothetical protein [Gammaproteobacteria bacterium]MCP5137530.1 hypothetical protein [Gammaproteobacteria bacterium]